VPATLINFGVTGSILTKFAHSVASSSQANLLKSELRYSNPCRNAKATSEGESAHLAHLTLKLVAMETSFERSEKSWSEQ